MTNAIISGRLRVAVVGDASPQYVIRRDDLDEQVAIAPAEARTLLRKCPTPSIRLVWMARKYATNSSSASDSSTALDLVLFLLDTNLSDETRDCAASELEELIASVHVINRLQQLLYAKPLPREADIDRAIQIAASRPGVYSFLCELRDEQPLIVAVRDAWNLMPFDEGKRRAFESAFLTHGVFAAFVKALTDDTNINDVVLQFGLNTSLKSELPNVTHVLSAWKQQMPAQRRRPLNAAATNVGVSQAVISGQSASPPIRLRADVAREAAVTQVAKIAEFVNQGKDAQAKQILDELLQNQMRHKNGETHAVKSLCNIVTQIRGSGGKTLRWIACFAPYTCQLIRLLSPSLGPCCETFESTTSLAKRMTRQ